jgi:hypothetical protein
MSILVLYLKIFSQTCLEVESSKKVEKGNSNWTTIQKPNINVQFFEWFTNLDYFMYTMYTYFLFYIKWSSLAGNKSSKVFELLKQDGYHSHLNSGHSCQVF